MQFRGILAATLAVACFPSSLVSEGSLLAKLPGLGVLGDLSATQLSSLGIIVLVAMLAGGWGAHPFADRPFPPPITAPDQLASVGLGPLPDDASAEELYLDTLKRTLINVVYEGRSNMRYSGSGTEPSLRDGYDLAARVVGEDTPTQALTMIGARRLESLQELVNRIVDENVPGDVLEAGCLHGGGAMFITAVLRSRNQLGPRRVFLADVFNCDLKLLDRFTTLVIAPILKLLASVPSVAFQRSIHKVILKASNAFPPSTRDAPDDFMRLSRFLCRNVVRLSTPNGPMPPNTLPQVKSYFARLGLLHPAVNFLQGFFADTLPGADIDQLALLRADGDTYESTRDVLENMYAKVVPGGFIVIDDYYSFQECREAVDEFREKVGDTAPIQPVDNLSVYWRKA